MEILNETYIYVPMLQIMGLLLLNTLLIIIRKQGWAMVINFLFIVYWGYILNMDRLMNDGGPGGYYLGAYFGIGLVLTVFASLGFIFNRHI